MSQTISFDVAIAERVLIRRIVFRAATVLEADGFKIERIDMQMDITATHANGCLLDLRRLLDFDDFSFIHDISGIARHLDRETGKLQGHFRPRCAVPVVSAAG